MIHFLLSLFKPDKQAEASARLEKMVRANRESFKTQLYAKNRAAQLRRRG